MAITQSTNLQPTSQDLTFYRGITFRRSFRYYTPGTPNVAVDLTGITLRFHLRLETQTASFLSLNSGDAPNSNGSQLVIAAPAMDDDLGIVISRINLTITDEDTALFTFNRGYWRLDYDNAGAIDRIGNGKATISNP